jgi:phage terminase large subunit-like protein
MAQPQVTVDGAFTDAQGPSLRLLEWATPADADIYDPEVVEEANPASWITAAGLAEQRQGVPDLHYRRYHANQWTERAGHWLPPGAWQASVGDPVFDDGEDITVAVDVGGERSATAVIWINDSLQVGCAFYHGDGGLLEAVDHVRELARRYSVRELAFDPWRFSQAAQELEREGMTVVEFAQTDVRMCLASQRLRDAIVERRLVLPADPELARHAADAIMRHSRRGWRLDRPTRSVTIDGIVALALALERTEDKPQPAELIGWL